MSMYNKRNMVDTRYLKKVWYLAQQNLVRSRTMADPVVVAERAAAKAAMAESTTRTMSTEVVDYTNFDEHTYRFSSTSKKENESRYLCNK